MFFCMFTSAEESRQQCECSRKKIWSGGGGLVSAGLCQQSAMIGWRWHWKKIFGFVHGPDGVKLHFLVLLSCMYPVLKCGSYASSFAVKEETINLWNKVTHTSKIEIINKNHKELCILLNINSWSTCQIWGWTKHAFSPTFLCFRFRRHSHRWMVN